MNCCCHPSLYVEVRIGPAAAIGDAHRLQLDLARAVTAPPEQTRHYCGHTVLLVLRLKDVDGHLSYPTVDLASAIS